MKKFTDSSQCEFAPRISAIVASTPMNATAPTRETSLVEEAALAVQGCRQRVERAHQALREFRNAHMILVGSEYCYMASKLTARESLDREHFALLQELDEAARVHDKSLQDLCATKKHFGLNSVLQKPPEVKRV